MLSVLTNRTYRHLFLAQVIALVGTGLATVALGLLVYDLAGADAGAVLGTALAIKMVAYVGIAPLAGAYADKLPRKRLLVGMDIVRAGVALLLPFVDAVWQIYLLIFLLQSASAVFTPTFQATIPDILPDEEKYTKALSLSRLAYDLESLISPVLAAALLVIINFHWLFAGTAIGFVVSALLVMSAALPYRKSTAKRVEGVWRKTTRGMRVYLKTPRLVGLLAVTLAAAAGSAMVIVNTVVIVKNMGGTEGDVALALAAYGAGSMLAALALPRILARINDRTIMIAGGGLLLVTLAWPLRVLDLPFGFGPATIPRCCCIRIPTCRPIIRIWKSTEAAVTSIILSSTICTLGGRARCEARKAVRPKWDGPPAERPRPVRRGQAACSAISSVTSPLTVSPASSSIDTASSRSAGTSPIVNRMIEGTQACARSLTSASPMKLPEKMRSAALASSAFFDAA